MSSSSDKNERAEKRSNLSQAEVTNRETASNEATAAMPELIKDRKQLVQFLKDGGRSGISLDFGKPSIEERPHQTAAKTDNAAESGRAKESESKGAWTSLTMDRQSLLEILKTGGKSGITGDFGKPLILDSSRPGDQTPADSIAAEHARSAQAVDSRVKIKTGADGRVEAVYEDNSVYSRMPTKDGGYVERHSGVRPDDTFVITKTADGRLLVSEREGEKPYQPVDDPAIKTERDRLSSLAAKHITDPEDYARFQANMARFEAREHELEESLRKQHPKLSAAEITKQAHEELRKTYANISSLLEAKDNPKVPLDGTKRAEIAEQVMRNAASPTLIDQGFHNTCNVAAVEVRSYARHPAAATQLVVDMATKGEYITKSGTHVTINRDAFQVHETDPYGKYNPPLPLGRGLASQIFEVTAVNIHYAKNNPNIHYEQVAADPTATPPHNGEQLVDYSGAKPKPVLGDDKLPIHSPALNGEQIADVSNEITGDQPKAGYIRWDKHPGNKVETISDEASFIKVLAEAKAKGELPVTIEVHTGNEPFYTDSGSGAAGGSGGWHVVNVTDFQPGPPPAVSVDNQWGPDADHTGKNQLSVQDLYFSMREPSDADRVTERLAALQKDLDADKAAGKSDFLKEIELNMLKYKTGKESFEDCERQIKQALTSAEKDWKAGNLSGKDYEATIYAFERTVQTLPVEDRFKLLRFEADTNLISKEDYEAMLVRTMVKARKDQQKAMLEGTFTEQQQDQYLKAIQDFHNNLRQLPASDQAAVKKSISEMLKA
jgi:hypothetical protein